MRSGALVTFTANCSVGSCAVGLTGFSGPLAEAQAASEAAQAVASRARAAPDRPWL